MYALSFFIPSGHFKLLMECYLFGKLKYIDLWVLFNHVFLWLGNLNLQVSLFVYGAYFKPLLYLYGL